MVTRRDENRREGPKTTRGADTEGRPKSQRAVTGSGKAGFGSSTRTQCAEKNGEVTFF